MSVWKDRKKYLLSELKPKLHELGFEAVRTNFRGSRTTTTHVEFERKQETSVDQLTIIFDKYWRPKFQVGFSRREINSPYKFIRSGNLVRRLGQNFCWWGIRWFSLNKETAWKNSVENVVMRLEQVDVFLKSGETGKNVTDMLKL